MSTVELPDGTKAIASAIFIYVPLFYTSRLVCRQELFKEKLIERLSTTDIKQVKEDVLPFVRNPKELDIWSNDYFVQLAGMMRYDHEKADSRGLL